MSVLRTVGESVLGSELSLHVLQKLARVIPGNSLLRRLCWHAGKGVRDKNKQRIVLTRKGFKLCVNLSDFTWRDLYFSGDYEPAVTSVVSRLARPGQVWWDVGANIGWFTLLLSDLVSSSGKVIAFEPGSPSFELLQSAVSYNRRQNVLAHRIALAADVGRATFFVPDDIEQADGGHGRPSLVRQRDIASIVELSVETSTIDHFIKNGTPAPFGIKMDVEGFEAAVLRGGKMMFAQSKPAVIVSEVTHRPDTLATPQELVQLIQDFGYLAFHVETLAAYNAHVPIDGSWSKDFVFLDGSRVDELLPMLHRNEDAF